MPYICSKSDAVITLDVAGQRISLNVQDFTIKINVKYQKIACLGQPVQYLPTYASIEGSMTIHAKHDEWMALINHQELNVFQTVHVRLPPGYIIHDPSDELHYFLPKVNFPTPGTGTFDLILCHLIFKSLPLIPTESELVTFVVNDIISPRNQFQ